MDVCKGENYSDLLLWAVQVKEAVNEVTEECIKNKTSCESRSWVVTITTGIRKNKWPITKEKLK